MLKVSNKTTTPTDTTRHYVPRDGRIVKLSWDELTTTERKSLRKADERAAYVAQFNIYSY